MGIETSWMASGNLVARIPLSTLITESVRRGTVGRRSGTSGSGSLTKTIERRLPHHECVFSHAQQAMVTFPYRRLSSRRAIPPPNRRHGQKGSRKSRDRERAATRFRRHCAELFWETNEDDRFTYLSAEFEAVTGLDRHQVLQTPARGQSRPCQGSTAHPQTSFNPPTRTLDGEMSNSNCARPAVLTKCCLPRVSLYSIIEVSYACGMTRRHPIAHGSGEGRTVDAAHKPSGSRRSLRSPTVLRTTLAICCRPSQALQSYFMRSRGQQQPELGAPCHIGKAADCGIDLVQTCSV